LTPVFVLVLNAYNTKKQESKNNVMLRKMKPLIFLMLVLVLTLTVSCTDDDDNVTQLPDIASSTIELFLGEWQLENISLDSGDIEEPPSPVNLTFTPNPVDSRAFEYQGTSTCNVYAGNLLLFTEEVLLLTDLLTTEMLCDPQSLNTFESLYYDSIQQSNTYRIDQETLSLTTEDGITLNFSRAD